MWNYTSKVIVGTRSFVTEPMPEPAVADVRVLARAMVEFYKTEREDLLAAYSDGALRRIWKAQQFSRWVTSMLHQVAELDYVTGSRAASTALAENYVGLPFEEANI